MILTCDEMRRSEEQVFASGVEVDRFNMTEKMAAKFDSGTGPLREILA